MANAFKRVGNAVVGSPHVITVFIIFLAGLITACAIMFEDYSTSRLGYEAIPTLKANVWIIPVVAWLPQLAQAIFAYNFLFDTNKRWSLLVAIACFLFDIGTDIFYKSNHLASPGLTAYAVFESLVVYTFGSEVLFTVSLGMVVTLFPRFWVEFLKFLKVFLKAVGDLLKIIFGIFGSMIGGVGKHVFPPMEKHDDDEDDEKVNFRDYSKPPKPQKQPRTPKVSRGLSDRDPLREFRTMTSSNSDAPHQTYP